MNIKAAIWDLDGTLLNTLDDLAASTNAALLGGTGRVLVVTSDYHLRRAVMTARHAGLRADGLAAKTTGGHAGKRLMEVCYIADLMLGWQDEGRTRPAWTYRLFARAFGEQAKK